MKKSKEPQNFLDILPSLVSSREKEREFIFKKELMGAINSSNPVFAA